MEELRIERLHRGDSDAIFAIVLELLEELGEEKEDLGGLRVEKVRADWTAREGDIDVLGARDTHGKLVGLLTLTQAFAIYANGRYGIIDEMYVTPAYRSAGIGHRLIAAAREIGREKGWQRIDVTTPESERWARTRRFYQREGFTYAGAKLKLNV
jgi:GNAT superfamily N-acetyltransferase